VFRTGELGFHSRLVVEPFLTDLAADYLFYEFLALQHEFILLFFSTFVTFAVKSIKILRCSIKDFKAFQQFTEFFTCALRDKGTYGKH
jgi:hypothetical protein